MAVKEIIDKMIKLKEIKIYICWCCKKSIHILFNKKIVNFLCLNCGAINWKIKNDKRN